MLGKNVHNLVVDNNRFSGQQKDIVLIGTGDTPQSARILDNYFLGSANTSSAVEVAWSSTAMDHLHLQGNRVTGGHRGFVITGEHEGGMEISLVNNTIMNTTDDGVFVDMLFRGALQEENRRTNLISLVGNQITQSGGRNVYLGVEQVQTDRLKIAALDNRFDHAGGNGIELYVRGKLPEGDVSEIVMQYDRNRADANGGHGMHVISTNLAHFELRMQDNQFNGNGADGFHARHHSFREALARIESSVANNNQGGGFQLNYNGYLPTVSFREVKASDNGGDGIRVRVDESILASTVFTDVEVNNNTGSGLSVLLNAEAIASCGTVDTPNQIRANGNAADGVSVQILSAMFAEHSTQSIIANSNGGHGVHLDFSDAQSLFNRIGYVDANANAGYGINVLLDPGIIFVDAPFFTIDSSSFSGNSLGNVLITGAPTFP